MGNAGIALVFVKNVVAFVKIEMVGICPRVVVVSIRIVFAKTRMTLG